MKEKEGSKKYNKYGVGCQVKELRPINAECGDISIKISYNVPLFSQNELFSMKLIPQFLFIFFELNLILMIGKHGVSIAMNRIATFVIL
jgi:hypothetical protein